MQTARILVVDGSTLYRNLIAEALAGIGGAEVVGSAPNGALALKHLQSLTPSLVFLDTDLPEGDSLQVLQEMCGAQPDLEVVMTSDGSREAAERAIQALNQGALDIVSKPPRTRTDAQLNEFRTDLKKLIDTSLTKKLMGQMSGASASTSAPVAVVRSTVPSVQLATRRSTSIKIVVIGISTGGPKALAEILPQFANSFPVPILIVQHMPATFTQALTSSLDKRSALHVVEGQDGQSPQAGVIHIAPGGRQMKIVVEGTHRRISLTDDPPENHCRPAADYLFRSVAEIYGAGALGVVMTGMGADGREGLRLMKAQGGRTVAQDEETSLVFGMPMEAIKAGVVDDVVALHEMADTITRIVAGHA